MPLNNWNFYRAVSVGSDHKSWLSENPQVEDGRIGGNQEFDGEVTDQYQYEVNHMMRRLRLNFYRAEDAFLILKKRQWAEEDKEFTMKQEERKRNAKKKRLLRNKQRRERKEMELRSMSLPSLNNLYMPDENHSFITKNLDTLKKNFVCKGCKSQMHMGQNIYQCSDGHIICNICSTYLKVSIHSLYYWSAELALNLHNNIFLQGVC